MADPSRQISESGARNNPPRRRSAEERHEVGNVVDNEANIVVDNEAPIDANNNAQPNLDVDTPSPDSLIVTSTTPEDLDSNQETVRASSGLSSEATPPSSVESPSLEEDLPPADSPENQEVTSTSNLNPHSTTTSPPILRGLAGMSIEESRLNAERNANEMASSSGHISSSNQEVPRNRRDQNLNVQNPTQGVGRSSAASDDCPISIVCRQILNSPSVTTASGPPILQRQPAASSSQRQPTTSMGLLEYLINSPPVTTLAALPARFMYCGSRPSGPRMAARLTTSSNRPIMSVPVTTPLTRASVHSSNRPPPLIPSSTNRPLSSFSTAPKQPVQSSSARPAFLPSSSKPKAMSPNNPSLAPTSTRPQSPVPFSVKQPPTLVSIASSISYNPATSSTSPVQTSATMSTSGFSLNRPIAPCSSTRHPTPAPVLRPPAFASSSTSSSFSPASSSSKSSIAPASSSQTKPPAPAQSTSSSKSSIAPASSSQTKPSAQASSSSKGSIAPASSSQTKPPAPASSSSKSSIAPASSSQTKPPAQVSSSLTRHPIPTTRFPVPGTSTSARPSVPDSSLSMHVKQATSSKPVTSCTEGPKKVVTTSSTSLRSPDHAQTSTTQLQKPLSASSQSTSSVLAKRTKEALKTVNVPKASTNPSSSSSKCPQSRTKSPIKSPIKRQANPPTQEIADDIDNTLSPIKRLKIVSKVGEGSKQSEKNGSSQRAAEAECEAMDDDSVLEIPSSEKNESEDENSN